MVNAGGEEQGKLETLDANAEYYTYGGTSPLWKLLLYTADETTGEMSESVYNFKNINTMINNVSKNTQNSTLRELDAAGILTFNNKEELNKYVTYYENGVPITKQIGEIELTRAIGLFVSLAPSAPAP
ncbi:MAG: hypothetical protein K2K28_02760 [Clostridia bacterium]|nr:hypothetical protein [Clostridia bacterium]